DHIHTHTVTTAAVTAAGAANSYPGEPWAVPKFYWTVMAESAMLAGWETLQSDDLQPHWMIPPPERFDFGYADGDIDAVVDASPDACAAKTAALKAHATQLTVGPTDRACALSNNLALPILAQEHYVLAAGTAGERDERGW